MKMTAKNGDLKPNSWLRIEFGDNDDWVMFYNNKNGIEIRVSTFLYLLDQYHGLLNETTGGDESEE